MSVYEKEMRPQQPKPKLRAMKPYAGEIAPPKTYVSTDTISGFTGYLPGIGSTIAVRFPTQVKMSRSYTAEVERQRIGKKPTPMGRHAIAPDVDAHSDRWGNFIMPKTVNQQLANLYLEALSPDRSLDTTHGVGIPLHKTESDRTASLPSMESPARDYEGALIQKDPAQTRAVSAPKHVQGYQGFRPGKTYLYGESYNRLESKLERGDKVAMRRAPSSTLRQSEDGRTSYEALNYSIPPAPPTDMRLVGGSISPAAAAAAAAASALKAQRSPQRKSKE